MAFVTEVEQRILKFEWKQSIDIFGLFLYFGYHEQCCHENECRGISLRLCLQLF